MRANLNAERFKLRWLDPIALDLALTANTFRVAFCLTRWMRGYERAAKVPQQVLADEAHTTRRAVQRALKALEAAGYLQVIRSPGQGTQNRYRLLIKPRAI